MTIYYCTHNAAGGGTGLSLASPMTIYEAENTATAGDEIRLCNTGVYALTGTNTWNWDNASLLGTDVAPILLAGYSSDGITMEEVTINGSGMDSNTDIIYFSVGSSIIFRDIRITGSRRYGIYDYTGTKQIQLIRCKIDNCINHGIYTATMSIGWSMYGCRINNNGGSGFAVSNGGRGRINAENCVFDHNTASGVYDSSNTSSGTKPIYKNCLFFRNGASGLRFYSGTTYGGIWVNNCTFFENTGDGILVGGTHGFLNFRNSIFKNNTNYGINLSGMDISKIVLIKNICSYNNSLGHIDINSGILPGSGHVYVNPNFISEENNSENLTPQNTNLKVTYSFPSGGATYEYIGAIQPQIPVCSVFKGSIG